MGNFITWIRLLGLNFGDIKRGTNQLPHHKVGEHFIPCFIPRFIHFASPCSSDDLLVHFVTVTMYLWLSFRKTTKLYFSRKHQLYRLLSENVGRLPERKTRSAVATVPEPPYLSPGWKYMTMTGLVWIIRERRSFSFEQMLTAWRSAPTGYIEITAAWHSRSLIGGHFDSELNKTKSALDVFVILCGVHLLW